MRRNWTTVVLAACSVALLAFAAPTPAHAGFPGGTGRFLYAAIPPSETNADIYDFDPTTGARNLTNTSGAPDFSGAYSPDGSEIAFLSGNGGTGVYVMDADGSDVVQVTGCETCNYTSVAWSPDATKLVVARSFGSTGGLDLIDLATSNETVLLPPAANSFDTSPAWSPDGTMIAFSQRTHTTAEIHVVNPDGTNDTNLTCCELVTGNHRYNSPNWAPDSSQLVFTQNVASQREGTPLQGVYKMNRDGTNLRALLTYDFAGSPIWSPAGDKIAYTVRVPAGGPGDIFVMDADGTNRQDITNTSDVDEILTDWEPIPGGSVTVPPNPPLATTLRLVQGFDVASDGTKALTGVLVDDPDSGQTDLFISPPEGGLSRLTFDASNEGTPSIADNHQVVYSTSRADIVLRNGDGSGRVLLVTGIPCGGSLPAISRDATVVVYRSCDGRLYRVGTDGSGNAPLTPPDYSMSSAAFSADGTKLAASCYSYSTGESGVCTMDSDGSNIQLVLPNDGERQWDQPAWSSDGTMLAVSGYILADSAVQIFVTGADGSAPQQLTTEGTYNTNPRWLPNGNIAYLFYNADYTASEIRVAFFAGDTTPPDVSCESSDGNWHADDVSIACTASDDGSGLADPGDASFSLSTSVPAGTETASAETETREVCDNAGNCTTAGPVTGNKIDKKAPQVTCGVADGVWHPANVSIGCTASDGGSGLASVEDASFTLSTNVPAGTETATAQTDSRVVQDGVGNSATAGPIGGNKVDRKVPTITVTTPSQNANYTFRQPVPVSYACTDGGSGVGSCTGTVPSGANLPTSTPGANTFTVTSSDNVGNPAPAVTRNYTVTFTFQGFTYPQNQPTINIVQAGRITPARFNLVDYFGVTIYNTYGTNIFTGGSPTSAQVTCPSGTTYNATQTAPAGIRYDTTNRRYEYGFVTSTGWVGTCRVLTLKFRDGTQKKLTYKFR